MANKYFPSVPFAWLDAASKRIVGCGGLCSSSLMALLFVIYRGHKMVRKGETFTITHSDIRILHLNRNTVRKQLEILEKAGVIKVTVKTGSSPHIQLLI